jgi:hypothetical protein
MRTYPVNCLKIGESLMIPWGDSAKERKYLWWYVLEYITRSKREFHLTKCQPCLIVKRIF